MNSEAALEAMPRWQTGIPGQLRPFGKRVLGEGLLGLLPGLYQPKHISLCSILQGWTSSRQRPLESAASPSDQPPGLPSFPPSPCGTRCVHNRTKNGCSGTGIVFPLQFCLVSQGGRGTPSHQVTPSQKAAEGISAQVQPSLPNPEASFFWQAEAPAEEAAHPAAGTTQGCEGDRASGVSAGFSAPPETSSSKEPSSGSTKATSLQP